MGKRFDSLVDILNKSNFSVNGSQTPETDVIKISQNTLKQIARECSIFDLPFSSHDLKEYIKTNEYQIQLQNFLSASQSLERAIIMPYPITAIEDEESVVIFSPVSSYEYQMVTLLTNETELYNNSILFSWVEFNKHDTETLTTKFSIRPFYVAGFNKKHEIIAHTAFSDEYLEKYNDKKLSLSKQQKFEKFLQGIANDATSFINEVIYIMDPNNFIIKTETNEQRSLDRKNSKKNKSKKKTKHSSKIQKTILRPHYTCLSEEDTISFLDKNSIFPIPFTPVRGYWKTYNNPCFVNCRGKTELIEQYYRGTATEITGQEGKHYQIVLKKSLTELEEVK